MPHIKSLNNKFWEIRVSGRDGIARGIYVIVKEKRVVVLHVFIKKHKKFQPLLYKLPCGVQRKLN